MADKKDDNVHQFPGSAQAPEKLSPKVQELVVAVNQAGLDGSEYGELIGALTLAAIGKALGKGLGDMGIDL